MDDFGDAEAVARSRIGLVLNDTFELLDLVASGGSAWVYLADAAWGDRVAVKVMHAALVAYPEVRARFVREAKIANRINHRGVVRVMDDGTLPDGCPFLVMEMLEGETLEDRAQRKGGVLPVDEVMWAADQLLEILAVAHKAGVVHRDVKPENIFLTNDRQIKLLDFGIARLKDHLPTDATRVGTLLGTVDFMPPEQARGEVDKVGVQADLWSVGATVFRLLSGRLVHEEERIFDQILASMSKPAPPLQTIAPHVPEAIALMVDYALKFDAPQRWPNARAMRNALMVAHSMSREGSPNSTSGLTATQTSGARFFNAPALPPMSIRRPRSS